MAGTSLLHTVLTELIFFSDKNINYIEEVI